MKRSLWLFAAVALFLTLGGCVLPEYFLGFEIGTCTVDSPSTGYMNFEYTITNTGSKSLTKACLKVEVDAFVNNYATSVGAGLPAVFTYTPTYDLGVGQTVSGSMSLYVSSGSLDPDDFAVEVVEVGFQPGDK